MAVEWISCIRVKGKSAEGMSKRSVKDTDDKSVAEQRRRDTQMEIEREEEKVTQTNRGGKKHGREREDTNSGRRF